MDIYSHSVLVFCCQLNQQVRLPLLVPLSVSADLFKHRDATDIPIPPPTATLLSLPNEIFFKIAHDITPNGGQKAGALRLTCRHLAKLVESVVWSSIVFPRDFVKLDNVLVDLYDQSNGHAALVASVRYETPDVPVALPMIAHLKALPALRRLHVVGANSTTLPDLFFAALPHLGRVRELVLEEVELVGRHSLLSGCPNRF